MMIRFKKNCDESGGGINNAGCTTEKSLQIITQPETTGGKLVGSCSFKL